MLDSAPMNATIERGKNLSIKVAIVTCKSVFSLKGNALPKYSPSLKGVNAPAANPWNRESIIFFPLL